MRHAASAWLYTFPIDEAAQSCILAPEGVTHGIKWLMATFLVFPVLFSSLDAWVDTNWEARAVALASRLMFALMGASPGGKLPIQ